MTKEPPDCCPLCGFSGNRSNPLLGGNSTREWALKNESTFSYTGDGEWVYVVTCVNCEEDITVKYETETVIDLSEDDD